MASLTASVAEGAETTGENEDSSSATRIRCKNCGEFTVKQDTQGTQDIMVCENCGWCAEVTFSNDHSLEWHPSSAKQYSVDGPTRQGKFFAPKNYIRSKERQFAKMLRDLADKVNLPEHEIVLCEQEGKSLLSKGQFGPRLKASTAGLVFVALQRQNPAVSFKEVAPKLDVSVKALGRTVKYLKNQPTVSKPKLATDEERMQAALDRLSTSLPRHTCIEAKKMAVEIKELCADKKVQGYHNSGLSTDCAMFILAVEAIEKKNMMAERIDDYAKALHLTPQTLRTHLWKVRTMLLSLAEELPSLGSKIKSCAINLRNIQQYLPVIIQNKVFLMINPDRQRSENSTEDPASATGGCSNDSSSCLHLYNDDEDESGSDLSDLDDDIKQYIATDKEVARKQKIQDH